MEHGIKTEFYDTRWLKFWDFCNKSCESNYELKGVTEKQNTGDIRRKWLLIWKLGICTCSVEWEFKYLQLSSVWQSGGRGKYKDTEWRLNSGFATITTKNSLYRKYRQLWNLSRAVNEYGKIVIGLIPLLLNINSTVFKYIKLHSYEGLRIYLLED